MSETIRKLEDALSRAKNDADEFESDLRQQNQIMTLDAQVKACVGAIKILDQRLERLETAQKAEALKVAIVDPGPKGPHKRS